MMMIRQLLLVISLFYTTQAFVTPMLHRAPVLANTAAASPTVLFEKRDVSRSGTRRERLDKLAELDEQRVETDKGFVVKAAGGFVGLIALLFVVAFSTGVLDGLSTGY
mmetsp:Transcript_25078/g.35107  ORF Transcript_25078/g.35107 Transcript_25078/m.35107 type:complete len:108 (+) Transcript_25078:87-410(+)